MRINAFSLNSILPEYLLELIDQQSYEKDSTLADFIRMFGARLSELANVNASPLAVDSFSTSHAYFAGLFTAEPTRSGLAQILSGYFTTPVNVITAQATHHTLPASERTALGKAYSTLGKNMLIGSGSWHLDEKIKVIIGPVSYEQYQQFYPENTALKTLIQTYVKTRCEIQIVLAPSAIPPPQFNHLQLGRNGWLGGTLANQLTYPGDQS